MPRNIELKTRIDSLPSARRIAQQLATDALGTQTQTDTYFHCTTGRLKLREIDGQPGQLIWYCRDNRADPRPSEYCIATVTDTPTLKRALGGALGQRVVVHKRREIYLYQNVRIHLDQVSGLGQFMEFEAVLSEDVDQATGHAQLEFLVDAFGLATADFLSESYAELAQP